MVLLATCTFCGARFRFEAVDDRGYEILAAATLWRLAEFVTEHGGRHTAEGARAPIWLDLDPAVPEGGEPEPLTVPGGKIVPPTNTGP